MCYTNCTNGQVNATWELSNKRDDGEIFLIRFAVLFDMDGTILKTETIVETAFEATFETLRTEGKWVSETPLDRYRSILGVTLEQVWIEVMPNASDEIRQEADQLLLSYLIEELKNGHGELYEGVKETLAELSEMGIPLFIASNGLEPYIDAIVEAEGLHSVFQDLYSAGRFGTKSKTQLVSKLLNDYEIQSGVFIGDRKGDLVAGSQNGLTTIGCQFGFAHSNELEDADFIVKEFSKVGEIIKRAYEAVMN